MVKVCCTISIPNLDNVDIDHFDLNIFQFDITRKVTTCITHVFKVKLFSLDDGASD